MAQRQKYISNRSSHTTIRVGYCLICGNHGSLTEDHVPPKGSIEISPIEQRHIVEVLHPEPRVVKGVKSRNGAKFKTICSTCNNDHLGSNDQEVANVHKALGKKVKDYYYGSLEMRDQTIMVDVNAIAYARALIGHILAATSVRECKSPSKSSSYFDPLKKFVLGDDNAIDNTHDIYYWFYPNREHLSAKFVGLHFDGVKASGSLLSFFPIAFWIVEKGKRILPQQAGKLNLDAKSLFLSVSQKPIPNVSFPFIELHGNKMIALIESQCIVSYPIPSSKLII